MSSVSAFVLDNPGLCALALCGVGAVWIYNKRASKLPNIPGPRSSSFLTGNLFDLVAPTTGRDWVINTSNTYGGATKLSTLFGGRSLMINDQKALHHLLVKEQDNFEEWEAWTTTNDLLFGPGLLSTAGAQHKKQRRMLTPAFSVKNLRGMTPMFVSIARELEGAISAMVEKGPKEIDLTAWLSRVALEAIGRGGMGVSFGKMSEPTTFSTATKQLAAILSALLPIGTLTPFFKYLGPGEFRRFMIKFLPFPLLKSLEVIVNIMEDEGKKMLRAQDATLAAEDDSSETKNIIGILLKANQTSIDSERMSDEELIAQTSTLIFTAMDTTSSAISRVLHQLAIHPEAQEKLRAEISEAYHNQDDAIDFNNLMALPYMDAVIKETLRVFPPLPVAFRQTLKDTVLPLLHPITGEDGTILNEVLVEKGTDVFVNVIGANHNPKTWGDDAGEWKPERWLSELPESVTKIRDYSGVFAHQMTFMAGNRSCIGFNFALLEMRVVLALFLQSFEFSLPKDKDIVWNLGLLMIPVIKGATSLESQLPLVVKKRGT
uniref:Cytochrome P450 n=1 Tax=Psilocybe cubensis TaxID=181762 RepID=A0A8H8CGL0_PSICU